MLGNVWGKEKIEEEKKVKNRSGDSTACKYLKSVSYF